VNKAAIPQVYIAGLSVRLKQIANSQCATMAIGREKKNNKKRKD